MPVYGKISKTTRIAILETTQTDKKYNQNSIGNSTKHCQTIINFLGWKFAYLSLIIQICAFTYFLCNIRAFFI